MKKSLIYQILFICLLNVTNANAQLQWMFKGSTSGNLLSGSGYDLINWKNNQSLYYKERKNGVNLGYRDPGVTPYAIILVKNGQGEITQCDNFAIFVVGGGYLKYKYRKKGISLVYTDEPSFQWAITTNNKSCNTGTTDVKYGLYNTAVNRHLIYYDRKESSIYLDWYFE
jgi:hypothetical protein